MLTIVCRKGTIIHWQTGTVTIEISVENTQKSKWRSMR